MIDIASVRADNPLPYIAGAHVCLQRAGNEWKGCCPFHNDKSPSFTIFDGGERFHCFGCGASGDVLDYVRRVHDVSLVEAARMLGAGALPTVEMPRQLPEERVKRTAEMKAIWKGAVPAKGTPAEAYLRSRGITISPPPDMRFARLPYGSSRPMPCLVAAVRDAKGALIGLQRIFLRPDGLGKANVPKPKLSLGSISGGAIQLNYGKERRELTICEGPEDGLSLVQMFRRPVSISAGAALMPAMQFPPEVQRIIIAIDNDVTGRREMRKAIDAFVCRGLECRVIRPEPGFKDFNDELMKGKR